MKSSILHNLNIIIRACAFIKTKQFFYFTKKLIHSKRNCSKRLTMYLNVSIVRWLLVNMNWIFSSAFSLLIKFSKLLSLESLLCIDIRGKKANATNKPYSSLDSISLRISALVGIDAWQNENCCSVSNSVSL